MNPLLYFAAELLNKRNFLRNPASSSHPAITLNCGFLSNQTERSRDLDLFSPSVKGKMVSKRQIVGRPFSMQFVSVMEPGKLSLWRFRRKDSAADFNRCSARNNPAWIGRRLEPYPPHIHQGSAQPRDQQIWQPYCFLPGPYLASHSSRMRRRLSSALSCRVGSRLSS